MQTIKVKDLCLNILRLALACPMLKRFNHIGGLKTQAALL